MTRGEEERDALSPSRLRVGIAGWSYPDWRGVFYPEHRSRGFSELRFAAGLFDAIEINNTFYRIPEPRFAAGWARQVEDLDHFVFTTKLHRDLTHGKPAPGELEALCRQFREGIEPLREAGRLGAVLLQFPWYFRDTPAHRDRLRALAEELRPLDLVVELRHRSFLDSREGGALPFLGELGLNFANIDLPRSRTSPPPTSLRTGPVGYFRLHGRNRKTWFDREAGRDEKYDYLYRDEEIRELLEPVTELAGETRTTYVIANNHYRGQAPANALQIIQLLGRARPAVPPELAREYPFLAAGPTPDRSA